MRGGRMMPIMRRSYISARVRGSRCCCCACCCCRWGAGAGAGEAPVLSVASVLDRLCPPCLCSPPPSPALFSCRLPLRLCCPSSCFDTGAGCRDWLAFDTCPPLSTPSSGRVLRTPCSSIDIGPVAAMVLLRFTMQCTATHTSGSALHSPRL